MTKITLNNVGSLIDATTAATTINNNFDTVETAFDNTLSRDGTSPNQMSAEFDMNSHQILNLPLPATANSPLRLQDLSDFTGGGTVANIPPGGTTNQVLAKTSNVNYLTHWTNSVTSVGLALPADLTVTGSPVTTTGTLTGSWAVTPTGTGAIVRAASPTLTGTLTAATVNASGVVNIASNGITLDGTNQQIGIGGVTTLARNTGTGAVTLSTNAGNISLTPASGNVAVTGTVAASTSVTTPSLVLNGTTLSTFTGTGSVVLATSPVLVTPALGTPSSGVATNLTGTAAGLTAGAVTTNANLTGPITSSGNATSIASQTGTGTKFVVDTSPTLVTPVLGVATATSINKVALTTPATAATLTILNNKTLTANNSLTLAGTDATTLTFQGTDTYVGRATTDTLTNKTYDTAGTGNSFSINGVAATANTGTGSVVRATSPALVTPALGVATATSLDASLLTINGAIPSLISFKLVGANFNSTADQTITITLPTGYTHFRFNNIFVSNPSVSLTTAAGGFYTGASKTGVTVVAAGQVYSALTTNAVGTAGAVLIPSLAVTTQYFSAGSVFFSLTTPQGSAATADIVIVISPLP